MFGRQCAVKQRSRTIEGALSLACKHGYMAAPLHSLETGMPHLCEPLAPTKIESIGLGPQYLYAARSPQTGRATAEAHVRNQETSASQWPIRCLREQCSIEKETSCFK